MGDLQVLWQLEVDGELCHQLLSDPQVRGWPLEHLVLSDCDVVRMGEVINPDADNMDKLLSSLGTSL